MSDLPPEFFIQELTKIRRELNVARIDVAVAANVNVNSIERWELNQSDPGFRKVVAWAKILGYEFDLHKVEKPDVTRRPNSRSLPTRTRKHDPRHEPHN